MTIYNILIPEEYTDKQSGEVKTYWNRVGTMFENKGEGFTLRIPEGVSITGRVVVLPRGAKEPDSAASAFEEQA